MERLTRDGVALAFEDVGKGAPPIVLIHDLGCDHTALQPQLEHFRVRHRVVAVDLLGHGQSDHLAQPYTLAGFADDLAWLCYELGVYRPIAVGHGIGAIIAMELAGRCPDLLAAVVALDVPLGGLPKAGAGNQEIGVHHLAAMREKAMIWDAAAALARCTVPVLYVQSHAPKAAVERLRRVYPAIVVETVRLSHLDQHEVAAQINDLIDTFLLGSLAGSVRGDGRDEVCEGR